MRQKALFYESVLISVSLLALLTYLSYMSSDQFSGLKLKQPGIKDYLEPSKNGFFITERVIKNVSFLLDMMAADSLHITDSSKQKILITGDSMSEVLYLAFREYGKKNGHEIVGSIKYNTRTVQWAEDKTLKKLIEKYEPTLVIMSLGGNELFIRNIKEREPAIRDVIKQAGNTKFIWVGPPNWKNDTGLNDLIAENLPPTQFFLSKNLKLDRLSDGAHPTRAAGEIWADSIALWITEKSKFPIVLERPE